MKIHLERNAAFLAVDAGTTNTRVWLVRDGSVQAREQDMVGVRDTAREGTNQKLQAALREMIERLMKHADAGGLQYVIAAGMITSPLGLKEIPHLSAPAGAAELAGATEAHDFPAVTSLPFLLVPGVRCGPVPCTYASVREADVMRGEETLCLGLLATGRLMPRSTLLNLGSHWKVINIDGHSRIASSVTSMSGELIHTTQTQTILADAVPHERLAALDDAWLRAGMEEQRVSGLARALFCVRLLQQRSDGTAEQRLAYLIGVYLASDLDAMLSRKLLTPEQPVAITGGGALAQAWQSVLASRSIDSSLVGDAEIETAMLAGFNRILRP